MGQKSEAKTVLFQVNMYREYKFSIKKFYPKKN